MDFDADATFLPPESRVLAAVSSGADSMALLYWLRELDRDFVVGHVNHDLHELRSGECERDESFVREKCAALGVEFRAQTVDLPRKNGHVNELVAREARYDALLEIARENNCNLIATAHTASDGLETALLHLLRGAAPGGWLGIAPLRALSDEIQLVRPFWRLPRGATREFLRKSGWDWREDASNLDTLFRRNRLRHEVLPLLESISGQNSDALACLHARNAQLGRDEAAFLENCALEALETLAIKRESDLLTLDGTKFRALDIALQRRVLRLGARAIAPDFRDLDAAKIEVARAWITGDRKRAVWQWRGDLRVEWTGFGAGNRVRFWRVKSATEGGKRLQITET